ncbi:MAG: branched-chain amino acid ABC transporter permease [Nitrososphaerales archaeon]
MVNIAAYGLDVIFYIGLYSILTLSLNLEYGFTGLSNFGIVAFFMVGAYTWAVTTMAGTPALLAFIASMLAAGVVGFLVSLPALRLRGDYLALATFVFAEIMRLIVMNIKALGGAVGMPFVPHIFPMQELSREAYLAANVLLVYSVLTAFMLLTYTLLHSPFGRAILAVREDEEAAQALGKNTTRYKYQVFFLGSVMCGAAGALYAQYLGFTGVDLFTLTVTFSVWIMCIIGGSDSLLGAVVGAAIVEMLARSLRVAKDYLLLPIDPNNLMLILTGILMVLFILYKPTGIIPAIRVKLRHRGIHLDVNGKHVAVVGYFKPIFWRFKSAKSLKIVERKRLKGLPA